MTNPIRRTRGFTLIEIMVVIAIIGLIMTFVGKNVMNYWSEANITATQVKMTNLKETIDNYRRKHTEVPDSLQVLLEPDEKNLNQAYLLDSQTILDAWGNEFIYTKLSKRDYEVRSLGADGLEGGEGEDADLSTKKDGQ